MRHLSLRPRYVLWPLIALFGTLAAIGLSRTAHADTTAEFTVVDYAFDSSQGGTQVTIPVGGTVSFSYPTGTSKHNVDFGTGSQPTSCISDGVAQAAPVPSSPTAPGWTASCTFNTPGTYTFKCDMHAFMTGTIVVTAATSTTSSATNPTTTSTQPSGAGSSTGTSSGTSTAPTLTTTPTSTSPGEPLVSPTAKPAAFLTGLTKIATVASTVPGDGDVNPYGIALVSASRGKLISGDLLVSNFNDKANDQGTGTTIVQISPAGHRSVFANLTARSLPGACPGGVGLTTALSILPGGYIVVGSLPTTNGKSATAKAGCLIVLNSRGRAVSTISGENIQGPWDMTAVTRGARTTLFVSNSLNGGAASGVRTILNSTVVRIRLESRPGRAPKVVGETVIATGLPWRDDPAALVIGPTGAALASDGTLYVADTLRSQIVAIPQAMTRSAAAPYGGTPVSAGGDLKQPLGLVIAPNGDIITTNAENGNMVETTPAGKQVAVVTADHKTGAGSLFGLLIAPGGRGVYFVDDGDNTLKLLH